ARAWGRPGGPNARSSTSRFSRSRRVQEWTRPQCDRPHAGGRSVQRWRQDAAIQPLDGAGTASARAVREVASRRFERKDNSVTLMFPLRHAIARSLCVLTFAGVSHVATAQTTTVVARDG